MYKYILILIVFIFLNQCSLDTKTGFWTKTQILEEKKENLEEVFKSNFILIIVCLSIIAMPDLTCILTLTAFVLILLNATSGKDK